MQYTLRINNQNRTITADPDIPLLWALRDLLGMTGTKYGCGIAQCGACMVLMDGDVVPSCQLPVSVVGTSAITTIEGLSANRSHKVQKAWLQFQVPQCGFCQSGMILAVTALLDANPNPTDADIDAALINICACGTYPRVRKAIQALAAGADADSAAGMEP
jgi:isoquinoline 1-oxidoreductase subunit alpha